MAKPKKDAGRAPGMTTRLGELAEAGDEARALRAERARESIGEWVPVADLLPWVKNPRKNDAAVAKVKASIERWGFVAPIIARRANGEVIAGHTRLKAAKALGLEMVPVRYVDLDPAQAHLYAIADNKLNELAEWDGPQLLEVLSEFGLPDLEIAGFDQAELDKLAADLVGPEPGDATDPDAEWEGMPEFDQEDKTAFRSLQVHFKDQAAVDLFARTIGQKLTDKTRFVWFPEIEIERYADKRYDGAPDEGDVD